MQMFKMRACSNQKTKTNEQIKKKLTLSNNPYIFLQEIASIHIMYNAILTMYFTITNHLLTSLGKSLDPGFDI